MNQELDKVARSKCPYDCGINPLGYQAWMRGFKLAASGGRNKDLSFYENQGYRTAIKLQEGTDAPLSD